MRKVFIIFLIFIVGLQSCNNKAHKHPGKKIFKYNESSDIVNLDPAFSKDLAHIWICNQLFNGLVRLDDSLHVIPDIAKKWSISPDGKVYTFFLRTDVYFQKDSAFKNKYRKVNAHDFVFSLLRIADPATASPGNWVLNPVAGSGVKKNIKALNDSVLQITLKHSFAPFLGILAMKYCSVVPKEVVKKYGANFRNHPIGTGPFYLKNWVENVELVLRKNPDYFKKDIKGKSLPYLDAVAVSFLKDKTTVFLEFVKGNLDLLSGIAPSYRNEIITRTGKLRKEYRKNIRLLKTPYLNTEYLGILVDTNLISVKNSPLKYLAIRKAINYGFNRKKMIRFLRNGIGVPGNKGIVPPGLRYPGYPHNYGYSYNPEKAKALLANAGFNNNHPIPPITLSTTSDYLDMCKYVQGQLNELGMDVHINVLPAASMLEMKANAKLNFFRASWIADYPSAENYLSLFYSKNFSPNGPNYTHYSNPLFDKWYEQSQIEQNYAKRNNIYGKMDSLVMTDAPVAILYYDEVLRFIHKNVVGMTLNPVNMLNLETVNLKDNNLKK